MSTYDSYQPLTVTGITTERLYERRLVFQVNGMTGHAQLGRGRLNVRVEVGDTPYELIVTPDEARKLRDWLNDYLENRPRDEPRFRLPNGMVIKD